MTDIVERLRTISLKDRADAYSGVRECCEEAADEIERLQVENEKLRGMVKLMMDDEPDAIERCAQVAADHMRGTVGRDYGAEIAAAIRALRDKP